MPLENLDLKRKKCYNVIMEKEKELSLESNGSESSETIKKSFRERASAFFDRNYAIFFAPIIVLTIYMVALYQYGVFPFGTEYTLASYDLSAQICPFIEHLFDVLDGKSSLFYSYSIAGGADITGTYLYFFVSPFSFLFLILGDGMVDSAASIVIGCKVAAISVSGAWFAKKLFDGIPDYVCIAVGVVYAYCGYTFVSNTYINWMDFLIYLPFAAGAFKHFVKTGKFVPFSVLAACCIYTCFSIACFSLFTVFPVLISYGLFCVEKEKRNKFLTNLCLAFVVTILISLPVLVPALMAYLNSGRGGTLFENFWFGYTMSAGEPTSFNSSTFVDKYSTAIYRKLTYIITDSLFVLLTVVWFFKDERKPLKKFMAVAGVFTLLPVFVDEAMLLMNMGSYMSYALRFGFLNALYFLGGACLALEGICFKSRCAYDGEPLNAPLCSLSQTQPVLIAPSSEEREEDTMEIKENESEPVVVSTSNSRESKEKKLAVWAIVTMGVALLAAAFLLYFTTNRQYETFWEFLVSDSEVLSSMKSFSSRFAHSLGGLDIVVVPFVIVMLIGGLGCLFVFHKKISPRWLSYILIVIVGVQVLFYNNQLVLGNRSTQHVTMNTYEQLCAELNEMDDSYFRVKDYSDKINANAPFTGNANAFSVFSSVIDEDNFIIYNLFAYNGNGKNSLKSSQSSGKSNRSDEFGDSFLGYKYYFVPANKKDSITSNSSLKKYVKPLMIKDENGKESQLNVGGYFIFENEIVFPSAYTLPSGEFRFVKPNEGNSSNRKANQSALYEFLRGKTLAEMRVPTGSSSSEFVTPETARELSEYLWERAADIEVGAGKITATVTANAGECLFLNFVASQGYKVTVNGKEAELIDNDLKFLSVALEQGENVVEFVYSSPYVKYAAFGAVGMVVGLCVVAFVVKKTKIVDVVAPVVAWAGIVLSVALVAFFMIYPTSAFIVKMIKWVFP